MECCQLRFSPAMTDRVKTLQPVLNRGMQHMRSFFENPALATPPVFWLTTTEAEMTSVLKYGLNRPDASLKEAVGRKIYRDKDNFVFLLPAGLSDDWLERILFMEYAKSLISADRDLEKTGWLEAGLAAYVGWMVQAELENHQDNFESRFISYYLYYYKPMGVTNLADLEDGTKWRQYIEANASVAISQSALAYAYLVRLKGPTAGVAVLKIFRELEKQRSGSFHDAFLKGTGISLAAFESDWKSKFLPGDGQSQEPAAH